MPTSLPRREDRIVASSDPAASQRPAGIACRGLTKRYGRATALDDLDLTVDEGEIFGFLGPNGAGKTTTLRILLGLIRPTSGSASINGHAVPDPRGLKDVGAMVEEPAFYPWLTGRRNLHVLAQVGAPIPQSAIEEAMDRAGIAAAAGDKVKTYSQGMRQRLGLAAALMRRPRLLLLDEPTNGLDPVGIRDFRSLLRRVAEEGTTVFLSSHLLTEVEQLCHRVAVVDRGKLKAVGTLDELGGAGRTVRVEVAPEDHAAALTLLRPLRAEELDSGAIRVTADSGRSVAERLAGGGVFPETITVERRSLEDLFMGLTSAEGESSATARV
jgi:ABC-2 type transport system ATP-binding protein